jgi:hypothetical protein
MTASGGLALIGSRPDHPPVMLFIASRREASYTRSPSRNITWTREKECL